MHVDGLVYFFIRSEKLSVVDLWTWFDLLSSACKLERSLRAFARFLLLSFGSGALERWTPLCWTGDGGRVVAEVASSDFRCLRALGFLLNIY